MHRNARKTSRCGGRVPRQYYSLNFCPYSGLQGCLFLYEDYQEELGEWSTTTEAPFFITAGPLCAWDVAALYASSSSLTKTVI
ncbi:hypothetical protein NPIL_269421, partial [Nephila pilipes]